MLEEGDYGAGSVNQVQRIGDTIHRPTYPWTESVNHFLVYLHQKGVLGIGTPLGTYSNGKSIYQYLPGTAALRPWIKTLRMDRGLTILSQFLLQYHQVQKNYKLPESPIWYVPKSHLQKGTILRHGDFGPWNTIWRDQQFKGVIDWDFLEPGTPIQDFAQLAWYAVPLRGEKGWQDAGFNERPDFKARLLVICQVSNIQLEDLLQAIINLQNLEMDRLLQLGSKGVFPWNIFYKRGDFMETQLEQIWLKAQMKKWL
ncbi:MAG: hypothetical protein Sapg2KO_30830 [Saprospiraceae bacterium]